MGKQKIKPSYTEEEKDLLILHSSDMLVIAGFDGYLRRVNPSFTKTLGWSTEELLAKRFIEFVHPDDRGATLREAEAFKGGKDVTGFENRYLCSDGTYRWIGWNGHPLADKGLIVGVGRDITERKQAEEELRTERDLLQSVMDGARRSHLVFLDRDFHFVRVNEAYAASCGYRPEEMIGKNHFDLYPHEENEAIFKRVRDRGIPEEYHDKPFVFPDQPDRGVTFWDWTLIPVKSKKGTVIGLVFSLMETTERKRAEEQLRQGHERMRLAAEAAQIGIWDWDIASDKQFWDEKTREIFGVSPERPTLQTWTNIVHPDDVGNCEKSAREAIATGQNYVVEYRIIRPDGTIGWVQSRGKPYYDEAGKPLKMRGINFDITERRQMEEELLKSRSELEERVKERTAQLKKSEEVAYSRLAEIEAYYDMAPVGLAILDRQLNAVRVNRKVAELGDVPLHQHFGRPARDLLPKKVADWFERIAQHVLETGEAIGDLEISSDTHASPGFEKTARVNCFPLKDSDGQVAGIGVVAEEITEKKRLEEQLRQSQKMEAIGTLAGGIAHDFNNMLAIIMGNAELALDDVRQPEPRRNLEAILEASKRSRDLVRQILTFSRRSRAEERAVDMESLLRETEALLRSSLPTTVRINLHIHTGPGVTVMADPSKIQQVILNLASNAAHAMSKQGGTLTIGLSKVDLGTDSAISENASGPYVKLAVRDTGTGIAPEIRRRMFEPFFTTKEPGQGTGMGLSVVYGIVKDFNGMIEVESEVGKGTTFTVLFPQGGVRIKNEMDHERADLRGKEHILLVDDEASFAEMTKVMLERLGYRVTCVTDSIIAMRTFIVSPEAFDLIITDQTMPDFTGIELSREVQSIRKDMPVILCTGYSETVSPETAREAGVREFLMKPIRKRQIAQAIRRALDKQRQGQ